MLRQRIAARDARAIRLGLHGWLERLEELRAQTTAYREAAEDLITAALGVAEQRRVCEERGGARTAATRRLEQARTAEEEARREATQSEARVAALQQLVGAAGRSCWRPCARRSGSCGP